MSKEDPALGLFAWQVLRPLGRGEEKQSSPALITLLCARLLASAAGEDLPWAAGLRVGASGSPAASVGHWV